MKLIATYKDGKKGEWGKYVSLNTAVKNATMVLQDHGWPNRNLTYREPYYDIDAFTIVSDDKRRKIGTVKPTYINVNGKRTFVYKLILEKKDKLGRKTYYVNRHTYQLQTKKEMFP